MKHGYNRDRIVPHFFEGISRAHLKGNENIRRYFHKSLLEFVRKHIGFNGYALTFSFFFAQAKCTKFSNRFQQ